MAAFSVISDDDQATDNPPLREKPAVLRYLSSTRPKSETPLATVVMPKVLLRLPDVSNAAAVETRKAWPLSEYVFWILMVLGALLAVNLIWSGKQPPLPDMETAPTWPAQAPLSAPVEQDVATEDSFPTSVPWSPPAETTIAEPAEQLDADIAAPVSPGEGDPHLPPPFDSLRTARGGEGRWDGSGVETSNPSEAAPVYPATTPVQP